MLSFIKTLLQASAWPIQAPEPYSAFHILLCAAGVLALTLAITALAARRLRSRNIIDRIRSGQRLY